MVEIRELSAEPLAKVRLVRHSRARMWQYKMMKYSEGGYRRVVWWTVVNLSKRSEKTRARGGWWWRVQRVGRATHKRVCF